MFGRHRSDIKQTQTARLAGGGAVGSSFCKGLTSTGHSKKSNRSNPTGVLFHGPFLCLKVILKYIIHVRELFMLLH